MLLKDELAARLADLRRLHEMSMHLSTTLELQPILDKTLRTAAAIEGTELGLLCLADTRLNDLRVQAMLGFSAEVLKAFESLPGSGVCGTCFRERRRVVVEDIETDRVFVSSRDAARRGGFRAVHATPLITRAGDVLGVLDAFSSAAPAERPRDAPDVPPGRRLY